MEKKNQRPTAQERIIKLVLMLINNDRIYIKEYLKDFQIKKRSLKGDLLLAKFFLSEYYGHAQEIKLSSDKLFYELL